LGVVDLGDFHTFVVADVPGLIEGAHQGAGLGDRFLRHLERTKILLHLVDVSSGSGRDPVSDYQMINRELAAYDPRLASRPQIVVATKIDALQEPERLARLREAAAKDERLFQAISSITNRGIRELVAAVGRGLEEMKGQEPALWLSRRA
jgi:GTP-binding protein